MKLRFLLSLLFISTAFAQDKVMTKPEGDKAKVEVSAPQINSPDEVRFDESTALKIQISLKDIQIAQEQQQSARDRESMAQIRAQQIFDAFLVSRGLKPEEWAYDPKRFAPVRRKEAIPAIAPPVKPEKE